MPTEPPRRNPDGSIPVHVTHHPDGTITARSEMRLSDGMRPVRSDVVDSMDAALGRLGGEVLHAMDPRRIVSFTAGGPPVWSVGMVDVGAPSPYRLLLTYGFSEILSPEELRRGLRHEYSFAVPAGIETQPWADAFLRHQCRYILENGADIRVNDVIPLRGVPLTRVPFQPEHHAMMPDSTLVGVLAVPDPVLPRIETPAGAIEVRRLVGLDARELDRVETWSPSAFVEELAKVNPLFLSPIQRASAMDYPPFADVVNRRAESEGSEMDSLLVDFSWSMKGREAEVELPTGRGAMRFLDAIHGRVGFGRRLGALSMKSPPIVFEPQGAGVQITPRALIIGGDIHSLAVRAFVNPLQTGERRIRLSVNS